MVNVVVQFVLHDNVHPNYLGFEVGFGQAKIIEEALNQQIALFSYSSCGCQWSCPSSYFIHVMKQHYVTCPCRKIGESHIGEKIANPRKRDNATIVLWKFGLLFS